MLSAAWRHIMPYMIIFTDQIKVDRNFTIGFLLRAKYTKTIMEIGD
jgi:hypothetical protein